MSDRPDIPRDDALLAAEHALSLLNPDERRAAERRMAEDPVFRAEVEGWQEHFAALAGEFSETTPRAVVKRQLMGRIFGSSERRRAWPWQVFGLASFAAALVLAIFLLVPLTAPPPAGLPQLAVAQIASEDGQLSVLAAYDPGAGALRYTRMSGEAPPGRALELWGIQGDAAPLSLGVLEPDTGLAPLPEGLALEGLVLAISDEPPGGSPTGAPTGTVLAVGQVTGL
jgi:anti-sigma-K factor RskA